MQYFMIDQNQVFEIPAKEWKTLLEENKVFYTRWFIEWWHDQVIIFDMNKTSIIPMVKFLMDFGGVGTWWNSKMLYFIVWFIVFLILLFLTIIWYSYFTKDKSKTINTISSAPVVSNSMPVINLNSGSTNLPIKTVDIKDLSWPTNNNIETNTNTDIDLQKNWSLELDLISCQNDVKYYQLELKDVWRYNDKINVDLNTTKDLLNQSKELIKARDTEINNLKNQITEKDQLYKFVWKQILDFCDKTDNTKCKDLVYKFYNK